LILGLSFAGYAWLIFSAFVAFTQISPGLSVCLIKNVTGIPCPSCGMTSSIWALFSGNLVSSIYFNPLGPIMSILIKLFPVWIISDLLQGRDGFYSFYKRVELALQRRAIAIPFTLIITVVWAWNVYKVL